MPDAASTRSTDTGLDDPRVPAPSILVVDDESGIRELLSRWLQAAGYAVTTAASAEAALSVMKSSPCSVALCDIRMPGHDGLWLAARLRSEYPETAVIMATGACDVEPAVASLRCGVVDYLTKPFGRDRLREAVSRGVSWHRSACEARRSREALEEDVTSRYSRLSELIGSTPVDSDEALDVLLSLLMAGNREAYAHGYRVAALAAGVARTLELSEDDVATIERGALLHDLGKLAMPDVVLQKPTPLTRDEQRIIRRHPALGSELIAGIPYLAAAARVVRDAHERLDGLGFPNGSKGDEVWIGARIVTVADAYDTMTRPRVFRDAIGPDDALREIECCSRTQFDPGVVTAFKRVLGSR